MRGPLKFNQFRIVINNVDINNEFYTFHNHIFKFIWSVKSSTNVNSLHKKNRHIFFFDNVQYTHTAYCINSFNTQEDMQKLIIH